MPTPQPVPLPARILLLLCALGVFLHLAVAEFPGILTGHGDGAFVRGTGFGKILFAWAKLEVFARAWPLLAAIGAVVFLVVFYRLYRRWHLFQVGKLTARLTGLNDDHHGLRFPVATYNPLPYLIHQRPGVTFVGLTPVRRRFLPWGTSLEPVYLSSSERSMHRHVLGKTGSGKTTSILWPQVFQDVLEGKGVLVIDAKGSNENAQTMRSIAKACGREKDLRLFSLPAWNRPQVFSHTYNLVHVAPRGPNGEGGDVVAMAERVFSVLDSGESPYYSAQGFLAFTRVCRLLHGMVGRSGVGIPFSLRDVAVCLRGLVAPSSPWGKATTKCLEHSLDRHAAEELRIQMSSLGRDFAQCLSGLIAAVDRLQSPLVNAYAPDLVFEEALEKNQLVYVQLPSNLFKIQAPAIGKLMLMDLQQCASLRQVFRGERNQKPFAVCIDEFGSFADLSFIDSLNKLRDANIQFTLAHQSIADLELVSKEFAQAVLDNTRTTDVLALDNPEVCERLAGSLGTTRRLENTVQQGVDELSVFAPTGVMSTRAVEAYRLHPNRLKQLAARGQGFLFATRANGRVAIPILYGQMPQFPVPTEPLQRNDQSRARGLRLEDANLPVTTHASASSRSARG
jgi:hypothetical protein